MSFDKQLKMLTLLRHKPNYSRKNMQAFKDCIGFGIVPKRMLEACVFRIVHHITFCYRFDRSKDVKRALHYSYNIRDKSNKRKGQHHKQKVYPKRINHTVSRRYLRFPNHSTTKTKN